MTGKRKRKTPAGSGDTAYPSYASLIGLRDPDAWTTIEVAREGLAYDTLETFQHHTQFSTKETAELVSIPPRTLMRRKAEGRLDPQESDRLVRAARVFARVLGFFDGDARAARDWFQAPAPAFGGTPPMELARTDLGSREVEALLDRLEHGVLT